MLNRVIRSVAELEFGKYAIVVELVIRLKILAEEDRMEIDWCLSELGGFSFVWVWEFYE